MFTVSFVWTMHEEAVCIQQTNRQTDIAIFRLNRPRDLLSGNTANRRLPEWDITYWISYWTDKNRYAWNCLQQSAVILTVCNCLQLSWQSATVQAVWNCFDSLQLWWQSETVLTFCNCLNRTWFVPYWPLSKQLLSSFSKSLETGCQVWVWHNKSRCLNQSDRQWRTISQIRCQLSHLELEFARAELSNLLTNSSKFRDMSEWDMLGPVHHTASADRLTLSPQGSLSCVKIHLRKYGKLRRSNCTTSLPIYFGVNLVDLVQGQF